MSNSHRLERISFHLVATALTILDGPFWVYDVLHQRRQAPIRVGYLPALVYNTNAARTVSRI